jgi:imidazole glycerol-phosphate synthase subunit HisF
VLKNRLIPIIILKDGLIVQSFNFKRFLPIGKLKTAIDFFVNWDVDEIVILDIDATKQDRGPKLEVIKQASRECFVPLTIGGGIRSMGDIKDVLRSGADKISINTYAVENPKFITDAAVRFGNQCITVSIDVMKVSNQYNVFIRNGKVDTGIEASDWAKKLEFLGAGEILINSIERDGSRKGYDLKLLNLISSNVNIPVIACGGVGDMRHLVSGILDGRCQAVAAANIFQHTEHSTIAAKAIMNKLGAQVRLSSDVKYEDFDFDIFGRPI